MDNLGKDTLNNTDWMLPFQKRCKKIENLPWINDARASVW